MCVCACMHACVCVLKQPEIFHCTLVDAPNGVNESITVQRPFGAFKKTAQIQQRGGQWDTLVKHCSAAAKKETLSVFHY